MNDVSYHKIGGITLKELIPDIIKTTRCTLDSDKQKKAEVEAYVKNFDLDILRDICNVETGEYDFDKSHTLFGIENYLGSHGFSTIRARGENIVESTQGVKRVDLLIRTITACKEFMAEREREDEEGVRPEKEEAEKEQSEKQRLEGMVRELFEGLGNGEFNPESLSAEERSVLVSLFSKSGMGLSLDLLSQMTGLQRKVASNAIESRLEEEAYRSQRKIRQSMLGEERQATVDDIMIRCLKEPRIFYNLANIGEDPKTILNFLGEYMIKPRLGVETKDGGSLIELLAFLQEPIMDEVAGILTAVIEAYMALQKNEILKAAKLELKKQQIASYCETLSLMEEAGIPKDVSAQLLCAQIGRPSPFPGISVPIKK